MRAVPVVVLALGAIAALPGPAADRAKEESWIGNRRNWWAFQKPVRSAAPELKDPWVLTPIDAFILQALREKNLSPSPSLDRQRLLRRVTLDLTGLPPTRGEIEAFQRDGSPAAYRKAVDRLMASPQYGERWAQRWLDVVRYADTNGFELDAERAHAWRYRDYVVRAFNRDKPYNQFLREQVAGDELYPGNDEALIATGFHRAGPIHIVGGNQDEEMNRQELVSEFAYGVTSVFLGLTMQCAKCHDHKFDPILQADYYRLQGIFGATESKELDISSPEERAAYEAAMKEYKARIKPIETQIEEIEKPYRERLKAAKRSKLDAKLTAVLDIPKEKRTPEQAMLAKDAMAQIGVSWDETLAAIPAEEKARRAGLRKQLHALEFTKPEPPPKAYAVADNSEPEQTHILKIGDPKFKLAPVNPGFPTVLAPDNGNVPLDACSRRAALAKWLASADHPLTARVMVNRIWQFRMGAGLVRTANDFGRLGERPTNPKLLDFLADEFVARGWSVKAIDRLIVTSNVYMQSAATNPAGVKVDSENKLYWRAHRRRLEGEAIRDSILAVSGNLNLKAGGRPVRVPIEQEIYDLIFTEGEPDNLWPLNPDVTEQYRRSLYLLNKRTVRLPMLANFDQPDAMTSCPVRPTSTHALQALSLMNSDFAQQQSKLFATRLEQACRADRDCQVRLAYKLALARAPRLEETKMARDFFASSGTLADFCLAMVNRNEFVYVP